MALRRFLEPISGDKAHDGGEWVPRQEGWLGVKVAVIGSTKVVKVG